MTAPLQLTLGFSPCPNDTFIFHGLINGLIDSGPLRFTETIIDVEELNRMAMECRLDITKLSFHALGHLLNDYVLLPTGAALGRGCGPLLISSRPLQFTDLASAKIAIPGRLTTAALLLKLFVPHSDNLIEMRFDQIMPAIANQEVDAGVIIHESRFTYQKLGLLLLYDLGEWWEQSTGYPIPLGGIAAKRSLGFKRISAISRLIRASVDLARSKPLLSREYVKKFAQEMQEEVLSQHISLYVNQYSVDLGPDGLQAIEHFLRQGVNRQIFPTWRTDFHHSEPAEPTD